MSSTVDANILLYASDASSPFHLRALGLLTDLAAGPDLLYVFWPTVMSYLRIATHPAIFERPLEPAVASGNIDRLLEPPHVRTAGESDRFWQVWRATTEGLTVRGNLVPDAHVVALMREHGVGTIWSHDRDLRKFDGIRVRDPFATSARDEPRSRRRVR